ncbi:unnamed protein product [Linum trigynum]|uniref:Uncharacterized protein n=1 Tax=Linum trigynum TaxID=586398 RepID=A0AAV2C9I3_9ROSI
MEKRCSRLEVESSLAKLLISGQILTFMAVTATARPLSPLLCPLQSNWVEVLPCVPPPTTVQHIFVDLTLSIHPPLPQAKSDEEEAPTAAVAEEAKIEESPSSSTHIDSRFRVWV